MRRALALSALLLLAACASDPGSDTTLPQWITVGFASLVGHCDREWIVRVAQSDDDVVRKQPIGEATDESGQ